MRFGVLGPLVLWAADGRQVTVPEAKVRALLAALVVQEGRPATADRLIDDVWGERPPGKPEAALRVKVSQLRRALADAEPGGRDLLAFQAPAYRLAGSSDADRFAELLAAARQSTDLATRAGLLSDALALWRGPALAEFADFDFARPVIARLEEQRLVALEEHAEVRLELGEHGALAAELADVVTEHPLRERLRAVHLRALYRAGRQSEALDSYAELRDRLRDELGLDPGPELVALHGAILAQDPALAPEERSRGNLPGPVSELIGRDGALAEVTALLGDHRLVTLTGPGGVGKTRLALEAGAAVAADHPDGVWLVELAAIDQPSVMAVYDAMTSALGVRDDVTHHPGEGCRLMDAVGDRRLLLILDNCEHLMDPVGTLVQELLKSSPHVTILATSREPLNMTGEVLRPVPPLDLPGSAALHGVAGSSVDVASSSAVQLFAARARAAAPSFVVDEGNAADVAAICVRLDGIPLALELAAARIRVLSPAQLLDRLDDRFRLLGAGRRDAPVRQQTLRAMIDWSWELLSDAERVVLRRMSVHCDGCTLETAEALCSGHDVEPYDVLDALARLVDRSLVVTVASRTGGFVPAPQSVALPPSGLRYRLLESVAAYSAERLEEAGEADLMRRRHLAHYVAFAEEAETHLRGHGQRAWLSALDAESANLRSALDTAVHYLAAEEALRLVNALAWYWTLRGRFDEGRRALDLALSIPGAAPTAARAEAMVWHAGLTIKLRGCPQQGVKGMEALRLLRESGERGRVARMEWFLGFAQWGQGELGATGALLADALATFEDIGDRWGTAAALSMRASHAMVRGDFAAVKRDSERGAALFQELGDRAGLFQTTSQLAALAEISADYRRADDLHTQALQVAEELELWPEVSRGLSGLGRIALLTGDWARADELHERARELAVQQGDLYAEHFADIGLALSARRQGRLDEAETRLRSWMEWLLKIDGEMGTALVMAELGFIAELRGDAAAALALHLEGYELAGSTGDPRAIALALEGLAGAESLAGEPTRAARLLGAAAACRDSVGMPLPPAERTDVNRITTRTVAALGEAAFQTAFEDGAHSTPPLATHS
ncbi:BTAD domain-containing putative transcriptional regulator [Nonomuraea sp. NPDC050556]|uniref:BTAD domain-containing putative transcriptional regulator n=1 Tax=Nonomuraea sp. NPDC050556 TaxID=3364369 RepID=UPI0037BBB2EF